MLTAAYGQGLLSQSTLAYRVDQLVRSRIIEPDQLIGDLTFRAEERGVRARVSRLVDRLRRLQFQPGEQASDPVTLLALDWTGATDGLLVGRDPGCQVILENPTVSRRHAQLRFRDGLWILEDLDSTNGTTINGASVARCQLCPGDQVVLGEQPLLVD